MVRSQRPIAELADERPLSNCDVNRRDPNDRLTSKGRLLPVVDHADVSQVFNVKAQVRPSMKDTRLAATSRSRSPRSPASLGTCSPTSCG